MCASTSNPEAAGMGLAKSRVGKRELGVAGEKMLAKYHISAEQPHLEACRELRMGGGYLGKVCAWVFF